MMRKIILFVLVALLLVATPSHVFAEAMDESFYSSNDILYYDPNACTSQSGTSNITPIEGDDRLEQLLRFFTGKGLSLAAAAGIAGNIKQESGWNPAMIQGGAIAPDNYVPVNKTGFGLAQWTFTARQKPLVEFAKANNLKITDMSMQLGFMWKELTTGYRESTLVRMNQEKTDPARAAWIFHKYYEGSDDSEAQVREGRGKPSIAIYEKYKATIPDGAGVPLGASSTPSTPDNAYGNPENNLGCSGSDSAGTTTTTGDTSKATSVTPDGFAVYSQFDPRWADEPIKRDSKGSFAMTTVWRSGCGPTSMAMIITKLTGVAADMKVIAKQASDLGVITAGGGYRNMSQKFAPLYGLKTKNIPGTVASINSALRSGAMIHLAGQGAAPFTGGGHFIMLRGITANGKWLIGDSNGLKGAANSAKMEGWDPQQILNDARTSDIYAVTKA